METRCYGCMRIKQSSPECEHCGFDERSRNNKHQLPIGTEVGGQYILGRVLGQGGFGITYIAWDKVLKQRVAVKEYFPSGYAGRDTHDHTVTSYDDADQHTFDSNKRRFLREAESLAKLWSIPQIVKILRCFEENGTAYIAMEYVEGMDLRKHLKQLGRPMTMDEVLSILGPVMEALEQVHKANLVHRDISPDNIMVLPDGSAKLLDFGAARYVENANAEQDRNTSTQAILKHGFAPPEQYSSHGALGPWTDVYAMCATIYYCLTGRIPAEAMSRVMEGQEIQWNRIQSLTPRQKSALIKGMEISPKNRFPTIDALRKVFVQLTQPNQLTKKHNRPKYVTAKKKPSNHIHIIFLSALCIIVILFFLISIFCFFKLKSELSFYNLYEESESQSVTIYTAPVKNNPDTKPIIHDIPPSTEATVPSTSPNTPLNIASVLNLEEVEPGHCETIPIISNHRALDIQWESSNPKIATISDLGILTAHTFGTVEITAKYKEYTEICIVTITLKSNIVCKFQHDENGVAIVGYIGALPPNVIFPQHDNFEPVTRIAWFTFQNANEIVSIIVPPGITTIGDYAFSNCKNLSSIQLPNTITYIGGRAFDGCTSLKSIYIPENVEIIEWAAFANCSNLISASVPHNCIYAENAFPDGCSITLY